MKNAKTPSPILPKGKDSLLKLSHFGVPPERHAEFKAGIMAAAREAVDAFPKQLETVKGELRRCLPPGALAAFVAYGLQAGLGDDGTQKSLLPNVLQHHAELLQAVMLTMPLDEWGRGPLMPEISQKLFDTVPTLSDTFFMQRLLEGEGAKDNPDALLIRSIQNRMQMHTHGVRNWGYYRQVVQTSRDLYSGLDAAMALHHGFSATDTIDVLAAMVSECERRQSAHFDLLRKVLRGKNANQIVQLYYHMVPGLEGSATEVLAGLPKWVTREQMIGWVMAHWDLRLLDTVMFEVEEIAAISGCPQEVVRSALDALSLLPGALVDSKPEFLFLENPVWDRPAIRIADSYFCAIPQMAFSHIHRLMERLANEAGLQQKLKDRRAVYLEQELETAFRSALPGADVRSGVKWKKGDQQFESDLIVVIDRVVIVVEAKSHRLTPQGLRGAPDRVKRHVQEIMLEPSEQSARLEAMIVSARAGDFAAATALAAIGIDAEKASRVVRLSVTLADLSVLAASEQDFKKMGWIPAEHALAPTIMIADLRCIIDVLDNELLFLHYLSERSYLQKSLNLLGDELDFLGLYLISGFNLAGLQGKFDEFAPSGMSAPIDRYYEGTEAGLKLPKPKMELRPLFRQIVDRLTKVRPPAWTLVGMHLLSCADPAEQRAIERNLTKLRTFVRRNFRDPGHAHTIVVQPPENRKAPVMFHLFPEELKYGHRTVMKEIAAEAIWASDLQACVVFSRGTERWGQAFESVMVVERQQPSGHHSASIADPSLG
ncbi:MAG: hypothetical protein CMF04_14870 [Hyphomonas sp.]|nr:hypothetical protein [Hyphomonas sp.]